MLKLESQDPVPEDAVITSHLRHALIRNHHFTTDGEATFLFMQQLNCKEISGNRGRGPIGECTFDQVCSAKLHAHESRINPTPRAPDFLPVSLHRTREV